MPLTENEIAAIRARHDAVALAYARNCDTISAQRSACDVPILLDEIAELQRAVRDRDDAIRAIPNPLQVSLRPYIAAAKRLVDPPPLVKPLSPGMQEFGDVRYRGIVDALKNKEGGEGY